MLSLTSAPVRLCDRITRREILRVGGLSAGVSLAELLRSSPASSGPNPNTPRVRSCIVLFLMGGPTQHSTWDPKPDAPAEIRGQFAPIPTSVPGMMLSELLPRTATLAEHLCVLRAMRTGDNAHSSSGYYMFTGVPHQPMNRENVNPGAPNNWPNYAAIVRRLQPATGALPAAIRLPHHIWNTDGSIWPGQDAGFLGRANDPWLFRCEPASPTFEIPEFSLHDEIPAARIQGRQGLLERIEALADDAYLGGSYDAATRQAFDLLTSQRARAALRLDEEHPAVRDRYGRSQFGQSVLLARRLIEAGVRLVQVNWFRGADEPSDAPCWDSHAKEAERLKTVLVPPFDQAFSSLIEDLRDRGLLEETLIACLCEFGRSPRINAAGGRDHWGNVFSVALAGGGIRGGTIHGASDRVGGEPRDGLVTPPDLLATMYHLLGIRPDAEYHDNLGRPIAVTRGRVIREIAA